MSNPIEVALAKMTSIESDLREALKIGPNESDTRLKVLDRILFEVLEWKHEAVFTEPPTESGYIDYLLTVGEKRSALVVEAKRAGRLKSPSKSEKPTNVSLLGPITKPFEPGIRQAKSYASENGVAVAVVTDGESWLFFRASRTDGKKPLDGKGIFFPSMSSVMENFARFYELLSPTAVLDRRQLAHLVEAEGLTVG
ncbi:MAG: ATP-binding protein, partial [Hyphomicrobium sp.]